MRHHTTLAPRFVQRIYISPSGKIFAYSTLGSSSTGKTLDNHRVYELDKAGERDFCGTLMAWSFKDGHLTRIVSQPEGFHTNILKIDRSSMSCTVESREFPHPTTHRVVRFSIST